MSKIDLNAYLKRIGFEGNPKTNLQTLQKIQRLHPQSIPFENLNPFCGKPVHLELEVLQQKLVNDGRGGYCFEHNLLLSAVLKQLGFKVTQLAARVLYGASDNAQTPKSHMLLCVEIENEPYIMDVGFGGSTLTAPLLLKTDMIQKTPHEDFRLLNYNGFYLLQININNQWESLYQFDLHEQWLIDYQIVNWYLSNHPESKFVVGITAARSEPGKRYALRNNQLSMHYTKEKTEKSEITDVRELKDVLQDLFTIRLPSWVNMDEYLARII